MVTSLRRYGQTPDGLYVTQHRTYDLPATRTDYVSPGFLWQDEGIYGGLLAQEGARGYQPHRQQGEHPPDRAPLPKRDDDRDDPEGGQPWEIPRRSQAMRLQLHNVANHAQGREHQAQHQEEASASGQRQAEHLGPIPGTRLQHVTSVAFGGADLRTTYVGCLHTDCIFRFRSEVPGVAPPHWRLALP